MSNYKLAFIDRMIGNVFCITGVVTEILGGYNNLGLALVGAGIMTGIAGCLLRVVGCMEKK